MPPEKGIDSLAERTAFMLQEKRGSRLGPQGEDAARWSLAQFHRARQPRRVGAGDLPPPQDQRRIGETRPHKDTARGQGRVAANRVGARASRRRLLGLSVLGRLRHARSMPPASAPKQKGNVDRAAALLAWYDVHRRDLPWRARRGQTADAYHVWLSEIMLQQTTVQTVGAYYAKFLKAWPTVRDLADAQLDDVLTAWAGLGYYARARNLHRTAKIVAGDFGGRFPDTAEALRKLPGIGGYTSGAIAAIAFDRREAAIDANAERVLARVFAVKAPMPKAKERLRELGRALVPQKRAGDFAQALMDLGSSICTPKRPACALCPWNESCVAHAAGDAEAYPRRTPKREGALRRGAAFVAYRADGMVLVRTRPAKGLLGGMTEVPTTEWTKDFDEREAIGEAPCFWSSNGSNKQITWRRVIGVVKHIFTHFPLELSVYAAEVPARTKAPGGTRWIGVAEIAKEALPSVMRKVVAHALDH